jgi:hypothetical protein
MSLVKDLYLDEVEKKVAELEESGMDWAEAYETASNMSFDGAIRDRLADLADNLRQQEKDRQGA